MSILKGTPPTILVTTAVGNTGAPTVRHLREKGFSVRALVRRDDSRAAALRDLGAEVVVGSLDDLGEVRRAMAGVQRAYANTPIAPTALHQAANLAVAAQESGVEAVVVLSQWLAHPTHPSIHTRAMWLAERLFEWLPDVGLVTVNPGFFADNYLGALPIVAQFGLLPLPLGRSRNAPPSNEDIAGVVAAILSDPAPHLGRTYRPTGPELLDPDQLAEAFGEGLGRKVRYQDVPFGLMAKVAKTIGLSDFALEQVRWYIEDHRADAFAAGAPTTVVADLLGRQPERFADIVRRYAASDPRTRQGLGNLGSALASLARVAVTPNPRLDHLAEISGFPRGGAFSLAAASADWADSHGQRRM